QSLLQSISTYADTDHRYLPSFPTRRSSDLHGNAADRAHDAEAPSAGKALRDLTRHADERAAELVPLELALELDLHATRLPSCVVDRKSTRLNSSHVAISYAVFCLKKKTPRHAACQNLAASPRLPFAAFTPAIRTASTRCMAPPSLPRTTQCLPPQSSPSN